MDGDLPRPKHQRTFYDDLDQSLTGADVVGGHAFVRPAVAQFDVGDGQRSVLRGVGPRRQTGSALTAPLEPNGMRAVGEALEAQRVPGPEPRLVRQAGGVRGTCAGETDTTRVT